MTSSVTTLASKLRSVLPSVRVSESDADRVAYARDLWPRHHLEVRRGEVATHRPGVIVWPSNTDEVVSLVRWAHETSTPLVPFGAGSGVCAGILPSRDVVVVDLKRMDRWRKLDPKGPALDVECGHMGVPLEEKLNRAGYTLGHFPSSILCSTVGGWVAARSAGQCSGYYGKIEDMVAGLECVTGTGEKLVLRRRIEGPDLIPLIIGSEGTLAIITSVTLRLHPVPTTRAFASWSFPTTELGLEAVRALFQSGLRPAVARLYDPFDAMVARMGAEKRSKAKGKELGDVESKKSRGTVPGLGAAAMRQILRRPGLLNDALHSIIGGKALGGAMLVVVFEGTGDHPLAEVDRARRIVEGRKGAFTGEQPARHWFARRYAVSYRQAPMIAAGAFIDTMEVAAPWSKLFHVYESVRKAVSPYAFVMAHFSHAYPDGCCIYFSFAGSAKPDRAGEWDLLCEEMYDQTWRVALSAALDSGATLAHHHGVGRSKAPRLSDELGAGVDVVRRLQRVFDPKGILNPGNLLPRAATVTGVTAVTSGVASGGLS